MHAHKHVNFCRHPTPVQHWLTYCSKEVPRKGNPGLSARKIILKSGWMGIDMGWMLKGEPSVQFQREDKTGKISWDSNQHTYVRMYVHTVVRGMLYWTMTCLMYHIWACPTTGMPYEYTAHMMNAVYRPSVRSWHSINCTVWRAQRVHGVACSALQDCTTNRLSMPHTHIQRNLLLADWWT